MPVRYQVMVADSLSEKIEAYADMMGITRTDAIRHLVVRGLEQVQLLVTSKNSADALNKMTEAFDRGLQLEERRLEGESSSSKSKKSKLSPSKSGREKPVRGLVTPAQSAKSGSNSSRIEDIFDND